MDERRLIFSNLLNGVPLEDICNAFHKTEAEIRAEFSYIIQKVKNYCFLKGHPAIYCDTIEQAQKNRYAIFPILKIINLDKAPQFKIKHEKFDGKFS